MPKARPAEYRSPSKATATANPSGAFCNPMPRATGNPPVKPSAPKATPTASPSGALWIVIAMMKSQTRRSEAASGPSRPLLKCSCGIISFIMATAPMPIRIAAQTISAGIAPSPYRPSAASSAGMMREKNDAASITPAAKPREMSRHFRDGVLPRSTGVAPTAVMRPAARLPRNPSATGESAATCSNSTCRIGRENFRGAVRFHQKDIIG